MRLSDSFGAKNSAWQTEGTQWILAHYGNIPFNDLARAQGIHLMPITDNMPVAVGAGQIFYNCSKGSRADSRILSFGTDLD